MYEKMVYSLPGIESHPVCKHCHALDVDVKELFGIKLSEAFCKNCGAKETGRTTVIAFKKLTAPYPKNPT